MFVPGCVLSDSTSVRQRAAKNNHGTYYDVHTLAVAAFVGNQTITEAVCGTAGVTRLSKQIGANGTLPLEDKRTKSQNYHAFDTIALLELAAACSKADQGDLYKFKTASGLQ